MARANRHYIPGCLWHITHRCHKKEFLLTGECPAGGVEGRYRKTIPCREVLSQQGQGTSNLTGSMSMVKMALRGRTVAARTAQ